jgi:hypothetical protein
MRSRADNRFVLRDAAVADVKEAAENETGNEHDALEEEIQWT